MKNLSFTVFTLLLTITCLDFSEFVQVKTTIKALNMHKQSMEFMDMLNQSNYYGINANMKYLSFVVSLFLIFLLTRKLGANIIFGIIGLLLGFSIHYFGVDNTLNRMLFIYGSKYSTLIFFMEKTIYLLLLILLYFRVKLEHKIS